jgi:hypothetical protein
MVLSPTMTVTLVALLVLAAVAWAGVRLVRWARRGTKGAAVLAAAAFPFPDQPSPQEQVEHALKKGGAESGEPLPPDSDRREHEKS